MCSTPVIYCPDWFPTTVKVDNTVYLYSNTNLEQVMDTLDSVSLQGIDALPAAARIAAEIRFVKELERGLGSNKAVVEVYRAWCDAAEAEVSELSLETSSLAVKWPKAFNAAQRAGLKNIDEGDSHFEMHLARQAAGAY